MKFRVWGTIDGQQFDVTYDSINDWRVERKLVERSAKLNVMGMASVEAV